MGFRFRKSISIIPGVRVNLSNGAPSLSIGPVELRCQWERMERLPTGSSRNGTELPHPD